jgi:hypothetical protein
MKQFLIGAAVILGLAVVGSAAWASNPGKGRHRGQNTPAGRHRHWQSEAPPRVQLPSCPAPVAEADEEAAVQNQRYLRVKNDTGKKLTVWVQYRTQTDGDEFAWVPNDPAKSDAAVGFEIDAGEEVDLEHQGARVAASRVRIWAESKDGAAWDRYQNDDLWLVPETDATGSQTYQAAEQETYTFTFAG